MKLIPKVQPKVNRRPLSETIGDGLNPSLLVNGRFNQGVTGWVVGAGWIIQSGQALASTVTPGALLQQTIDPLFTPNQVHWLRYEITSVNFGQLEVRIGTLVVPLVSDVLGFHDIEVTPTVAGIFALTATAAGNYNGGVDNVSLRLGGIP